jgi:hypothetical protein
LQKVQKVQKVQQAQQAQQAQQEINHHPELIQSYANIRPRILLVHQQLQNNPVVLKLNNKNGTELLFLLQKCHMQPLASMMVADSNQYLGMLLNTYRDIEKNRTAINQTRKYLS